MDNRLTFKDHVAEATSEADCIVGVIRKSFDYLIKNLCPPVPETGETHPGIRTLRLAITPENTMQ
jgi:hypothetical protein